MATTRHRKTDPAATVNDEKKTHVKVYESDRDRINKIRAVVAVETGESAASQPDVLRFLLDLFFKR